MCVCVNSLHNNALLILICEHSSIMVSVKCCIIDNFRIQDLKDLKADCNFFSQWIYVNFPFVCDSYKYIFLYIYIYFKIFYRAWHKIFVKIKSLLLLFFINLHYFSKSINHTFKISFIQVLQDWGNPGSSKKKRCNKNNKHLDIYIFIYIDLDIVVLAHFIASFFLFSAAAKKDFPLKFKYFTFIHTWSHSIQSLEGVIAPLRGTTCFLNS